MNNDGKVSVFHGKPHLDDEFMIFKIINFVSLLS